MKTNLVPCWLPITSYPKFSQRIIVQIKYFQLTLLRLVVSVNIPGAGAPLLSINAESSSLQGSKREKSMKM